MIRYSFHTKCSQYSHLRCGDCELVYEFQCGLYHPAFGFIDRVKWKKGIKYVPKYQSEWDWDWAKDRITENMYTVNTVVGAIGARYTCTQSLCMRNDSSSPVNRQRTARSSVGGHGTVYVWRVKQKRTLTRKTYTERLCELVRLIVCFFPKLIVAHLCLPSTEFPFSSTGQNANQTQSR